MIKVINYSMIINTTKFIIQSNRKHYIIKCEEIKYLKGDGMYTEIYLKNNKHIVSKNIKYYDNILSKFHFIRIHKTYMVNTNRIKHLNLTKKPTLITDIELPIAKSYLKILK